MWSTLLFFSPLSFTLNVSHLNEHASVHTVLAAEVNRTEVGTYLQMQSAYTLITS